MKRTIILFSIMVLLVVGWSVAWFYIEGKAIEVADRTTQRLAERDQILDCEQRKTGGYPFRISFTCDRLFYQNRRTGVGLETGEVRSAAQAYQPGKVVMEVDGPAVLTLPNGRAFNAAWASLRSSLLAKLDGIDRIAVVGEEIAFDPIRSEDAAARFGELQLHGRRIEGETVQLAVRARDVNSGIEAWPEFGASLLVSLDDAYSALLKRPDLITLGRSQGLNGTLEALQYGPNSGGKLSLSGPMSVSTSGLVSGQFELRVEDVPRLLEALQQILPGYRDQLGQLTIALNTLGGSRSNGEVKLPLNARDGRLSVGIIPIGNIPPIY